MLNIWLFINWIINWIKYSDWDIILVFLFLYICLLVFSLAIVQSTNLYLHVASEFSTEQNFHCGGKPIGRRRIHECMGYLANEQPRSPTVKDELIWLSSHCLYWYWIFLNFSHNFSRHSIMFTPILFSFFNKMIGISINNLYNKIFIYKFSIKKVYIDIKFFFFFFDNIITLKSVTLYVHMKNRKK